MAETGKQMLVEVAYATPEKQVLLSVMLEPGATAQQAIMQSGILVQFPEIDLATNKIGIFSQVCSLEQQVNAHDRVEIYRPLSNDPKDARRLRAKKGNWNWSQ